MHDDRTSAQFTICGHQIRDSQKLADSSVLVRARCNRIVMMNPVYITIQKVSLCHQADYFRVEKADVALKALSGISSSGNLPRVTRLRLRIVITLRLMKTQCANAVHLTRRDRRARLEVLLDDCASIGSIGSRSQSTWGLSRRSSSHVVAHSSVHLYSALISGL